MSLKPQYSLFPPSDVKQKAMSTKAPGTLNHTPRNGPGNTKGMARSERSEDERFEVNPRLGMPKTLNHSDVRQNLSVNQSQNLRSQIVLQTGFRNQNSSRRTLEDKPFPVSARTATKGPSTKMAATDGRSTLSGLRRRVDSSLDPSSPHIVRKARHREGNAPKPGPTHGIGPAMLGTTPAPVLATVATSAGMPSPPQLKDKSIRKTRKSSRCSSTHELKPRPSSPTLVDTFRSFDDVPRNPPPTPVKGSPSSLRNESQASHYELKSAWDSDDECESPQSEENEEDEKAGLVERVMSLKLTRVRRGTPSSIASSHVSKHSTLQKERHERKWKQALLCGCGGR